MSNKEYFYLIGNQLYTKDSPRPIVSYINCSPTFVDLLNEMFAHKLLVRSHKKDLEAIYGKPIKKQLEEVMSNYG